jgi:trans-AT polyketide synthase, acyltransferase and oxidoreductase domains
MIAVVSVAEWSWKATGDGREQVTAMLRWHPGDRPAAFTPSAIAKAVASARATVHVVRHEPGAPPGIAVGGLTGPGPGGLELVGTLPPLYPERLGDPTFAATHRVRFPYVAGEMANGIASTRMVAAMARDEMLGFYGAAGLGLAAVERGLAELSTEIGTLPNWGVNLIHSPAEPGREDRLADLLQRYGVPRVSASAFMDLTPAVVRCAVSGLDTAPDGQVKRRVRLFAKVSRPEVAARFMSPAPAALLGLLTGRGQVTREQAELAARVPLATDVTVEADSGGHTDNRPLTVVLPAMIALRDEMTRRHGYAERIRVGAAGGLGDPSGLAAAFGCGADYVVTGTVNQRSAEAGLSGAARDLLASAGLSDVIMAPAADMFEYGIKVQVLRRGTMFAARAAVLYDAYRSHDSLDEITGALRDKIERDILRLPFARAWEQTRDYWIEHGPEQVERAESDPRHLMALVFRSYLGQSCRWAIDGEPTRRADYQIWCGPAIAAFNRWAAGTVLDVPGGCEVTQIARNLLEGAAVVTRAQQLRTFGVPVPRTDLHVPCHLS